MHVFLQCLLCMNLSLKLKQLHIDRTLFNLIFLIYVYLTHHNYPKNLWETLFNSFLFYDMAVKMTLISLLELNK